MIVVCWQSRVIDFINGRVRFQEPSYFKSIFTMLLHTKMERFNTTDNQPAIMRGKDSTACILYKFYLVAKLLCFGNNKSCYQVAVTAKIFSCAMYYNISSKLYWLLQSWGCK